MKKITLVILTVIVVISILIAGGQIIKDKEIKFDVITNKECMSLTIDITNSNDTWSIIQTPDCIKNEPGGTTTQSDFNGNVTTTRQFFMRAISEGEGNMKYQRILDNGEIEIYNLNFLIYKNENNTFQIDYISFEKVS